MPCEGVLDLGDFVPAREKHQHRPVHVRGAGEGDRGCGCWQLHTDVLQDCYHQINIDGIVEPHGEAGGTSGGHGARGDHVRGQVGGFGAVGRRLRLEHNGPHPLQLTLRPR